jgi:AdoMet-dependent heme synthase
LNDSAGGGNVSPPVRQVTSVPRIISWNLTCQCNMHCAHCYLDAGRQGDERELDTSEAKRVIDQIACVSSPLLILSGGEPLLRNDLLEIAEYGKERGFRMALGTNGTLITPRMATRLKAAGIQKVAISIDSATPEEHDRFRGVRGAWKRAVDGIHASQEAGMGVQMNTTVTLQNYDEIDAIIDLGESFGIRDFQLFFLVPTGRGRSIEDITPQMYEAMLRGIVARVKETDLAIRPTCAPQFMRIAAQMGVQRDAWGRGCIAGQSYCRIDPFGEVTPCPYLPLGLGNVRETAFAEIWNSSEVLARLRDINQLRGKCGRCEYRARCGGCRARAYSLTGSASHTCVGASGGREEGGDYLAEEPWCPYQPGGAAL